MRLCSLSPFFTGRGRGEGIKSDRPCGGDLPPCAWRSERHMQSEISQGLAMTQTTSRFADELAKLLTDAAGLAQGARKEVETFANE